MCPPAKPVTTRQCRPGTRPAFCRSRWGRRSVWAHHAELPASPATWGSVAEPNFARNHSCTTGCAQASASTASRDGPALVSSCRASVLGIAHCSAAIRSLFASGGGASTRFSRSVASPCSARPAQLSGAGPSRSTIAVRQFPAVTAVVHLSGALVPRSAKLPAPFRTCRWAP